MRVNVKLEVQHVPEGFMAYIEQGNNSITYRIVPVVEEEVIKLQHRGIFPQFCSSIKTIHIDNHLTISDSAEIERLKHSLDLERRHDNYDGFR